MVVRDSRAEDCHLSALSKTAKNGQCAEPEAQ
jgi:hypothetical protein